MKNPVYSHGKGNALMSNRPQRQVRHPSGAICRCTTGRTVLCSVLLFNTAIFSQDAGVSSPAVPASSTESPYVWLGFFQEHSRLLTDAETKGKGHSYLDRKSVV